MRRFFWLAAVIATCWLAADMARAAELQPPAAAVAGEPVTIPTSGSGSATLYLFGPAHVAKREVRLGEPIELRGEELRTAGRYTLILSSGGEASFFVSPAKPAQLAFLARPSRVPVAKPGVISGAAFVFDDYRNLVLAPTPVKFELSVQGTTAARTVTAQSGIAWTRMDSASREGAAQFVASVGQVSVRRVVQQTASEPCNLAMRVAAQNARALVVETAPIRDCSGNAVPDGTIVTFSLIDDRGWRSTIDSRIKKGVARAEFPRDARGLLSVAAGVVMGNELRLSGGAQ